MEDKKKSRLEQIEKTLSSAGLSLDDETKDRLADHPLMGATFEIVPGQKKLIEIRPIKKKGREAEEIANKLVPKILGHVAEVESIISCIDGDRSDLVDKMHEALDEITKLWDTVESFVESSKEK